MLLQSRAKVAGPVIGLSSERMSIGEMQNVLRLAIVTFALIRGLAEFASLQRWRLREWMAR